MNLWIRFDPDNASKRFYVFENIGEDNKDHYIGILKGNKNWYNLGVNHINMKQTGIPKKWSKQLSIEEIVLYKLLGYI